MRDLIPSRVLHHSLYLHPWSSFNAGRENTIVLLIVVEIFTFRIFVSPLIDDLLYTRIKLIISYFEDSFRNS